MMGDLREELVVKGRKALSEAIAGLWSGAIDLAVTGKIDSVLEDELRDMGKRVMEILVTLQEGEEKPEETPVAEETKAEGEE